MEAEIIKILQSRGPLLGSELHAALGGQGLELWRTCKRSRCLRICRAGRRYLRLDRRVAGYGRLSPSIWREFLTYSVIGLEDQEELMKARSAELLREIQAISRAKADLAYQVACIQWSRLESRLGAGQEACFIIAGDIVYNMAHAVPRPERSSGKLVQGSDIDLVVILSDTCPQGLLQDLDESIFRDKHRLLITPHIREEIDYVVKPMARVREQLLFDTFKRMVACKILQEGTLLCGSEGLFTAVKRMLRHSGVDARLRALEKQARRFRIQAEHILLHERASAEVLSYFYPDEEAEEFE